MAGQQRCRHLPGRHALLARSSCPPWRRDTECGADTAVAVHPGLINTSLARGWLVSTALPVPGVLRPVVAPVVRNAGCCWCRYFAGSS